MSNEIIPAQGSALAPADNPVSRALSVGNSPGMNVGAVTIEAERAIAEARGQMQLAKMFPRDLQAAYAELLESCKMPELAEVAFYSVPQGGQKVSGPSIRLAEEIARVYENFEYGHRELGRREAGPGPKDFGRSEVEVYAWDKQKNNRSIRQITVLHVLDTKEGPRKLRDQKDVDNKIANVASKQIRGRILALMPKWMVQGAINECRKTLAGQNDEPVSVRVRKMVQAFAKYGASTEHLETYLGKKLDDVLIDDLVDLRGVYTALEDGEPVAKYFGAKEEDEADKAAPAPAAAAISKQVAESNQQSEPQKAAKSPRATRAATKGKQPESDATRNEDSHSESQQHADAQPADPPPSSPPDEQPSSTGAPNPSTSPVDDDPF